MPYPKIIPHNDGAGAIDAVGMGVPESRIGNRVWLYEAQRDGRAFGTCAQFVVVPADHAIPVPEGISDDIGAALGVPAMTAHRCLFQDGPIKGQTILVAGGAGAVGQCAVHLARWGGAARIIATVGSDEHAAVARLSGVDAVLNYKDPDLAAHIHNAAGGERKVDRVVEVQFGRNVGLDASVLRPGGVIATYFNSNDGGMDATVPYQALASNCITVHFVLVYAMGPEAHLEAARDINEALVAGALRPRIARHYPLERVAEAHQLLGPNGAGGKVVIEVP